MNNPLREIKFLKQVPHDVCECMWDVIRSAFTLLKFLGIRGNRIKLMFLYSNGLNVTFNSISVEEKL